jgi:hypothetical protein
MPDKFLMKINHYSLLTAVKKTSYLYYFIKRKFIYYIHISVCYPKNKLNLAYNIFSFLKIQQVTPLMGSDDE